MFGSIACTFRYFKLKRKTFLPFTLSSSFSAINFQEWKSLSQSCFIHEIYALSKPEDRSNEKRCQCCFHVKTRSLKHRKMLGSIACTFGYFKFKFKTFLPFTLSSSFFAINFHEWKSLSKSCFIHEIYAMSKPEDTRSNKKRCECCFHVKTRSLCNIGRCLVA